MLLVALVLAALMLLAALAALMLLVALVLAALLLLVGLHPATLLLLAWAGIALLLPGILVRTTRIGHLCILLECSGSPGPGGKRVKMQGVHGGRSSMPEDFAWISPRIEEIYSNIKLLATHVCTHARDIRAPDRWVRCGPFRQHRNRRCGCRRRAPRRRGNQTP